MGVSLEINLQDVAFDSESTLFELADQAGIRVPTSCEGRGKCRECLLEVTQGVECLSPLTEEEEHLPGNFRLACRTRMIATEGVVRVHTLKRGGVRVLEETYGLPDTGQLQEPDPAVTREGDCVLLDGEVIAKRAGPIHGIAMDLGTSTVAMRLMDLSSGQVVATQSFENPQRFGGSDIMARIQYDTNHPGRLLQRVLLGYLTRAIETFAVDADSIYEIVIAGNPTMRDLFFGLEVESIGCKPYRSRTEQEMIDGKRSDTTLALPGAKLRLPMHPKGRVYGLPLIGCHVGADAAACLLAIGLSGEDRTIALMDIGTNTELVIGNSDRILATSCPAGPAFEGGELSCGMPAVDGAVERVAIGEGGVPDLRVIGGGDAEGVCGSGLIDLLSELLRTDRMNAKGRFQDGSDHFSVHSPNRVSLTEKDISQLAQAKGANMAGLRIVLETFGIDAGDLDVFYLAGGFARHIDLDAAMRIGLIPTLPAGRAVKVGNASLEGATIALCSMSRRHELEKLVGRIEHVQLENHPNFFDYFVDECQFAPVSSG